MIGWTTYDYIRFKMVALPQSENWTLAEYLAFEADNDVRHEFIDGQVYMMAGASENHNELAVAIVFLLYDEFVDRPCRVFQSDMKVQVAEDAIFYPDVVVAYEDLDYATDTRNILLNPQVIFEILSPSTEDYDRERKFKRYQNILSLKDYVLVSQTQVQIDHYHRQDETTWLLKSYTKRNDSLQRTPINVTMPLELIYRKVNFD